jgi:hypothetical protein
MAERIDDVDALIEMVKAQLLDVNTSIPAVIVSYSNGLASVKPTGLKRFADGDSLAYPIIQNVRVQWPNFNGGQCGVKGPVRPGDICYLFFAQQATDGSDDLRRFDLSDCYALMTGNSQTVAGGTNNEDMIMWFGPARIRLTAAGEMIVQAPGGIRFETPSVENLGTLTNQLFITGNQGLNIGGVHPATGTGSKVTGNFSVVSGDVTADSISLKSHVHSGVQPGGGNSGVPVP